jgi:hypothetical protein
MRFVFGIIAVLAIAVNSFASEDTLSFDRCQIVNDVNDHSLPSKLIIHFQLPEGMMGKEILLAQIITKISLRNVNKDSLLELSFSPFLSLPPEGDLYYEELEAMTDSLVAGSWTCRFDSAASFQVDITEFVRQVADGHRQNFGLAGAFDLLGDRNLRLPENLAGPIQNRARITIIYK